MLGSARTVASSPEGDTFFWLLLSIELASLIARLWSGIRRKLIGGPLARLALFGWGSSAFGLGHFIFDYGMMTVFSGADWDVPPGNRIRTALVLVVAALSTAMMTIRGDLGQPSDDRLAVNA